MPATLPVSWTSVSLMMATFPDIGSVSTLTSNQIATFAGYAEAGIAARIVRNYSLPFTQDIPHLTSIATRKSLHLLLSQRLIPLPGPRLAELLEQFRSVDDEIAAIADGTVSLVTSAGAMVAARTDAAEVFSTTRDYIPTFHEGPAALQLQDPNKVEDELDRRDITIRDHLVND